MKTNKHKDTNRERAIHLLKSYFGDVEKYDFNDSQRTGAKNSFFLTVKDIIYPSIGLYITIRKWIKIMSDSTDVYGDNEGSSLRYNSLLTVWAAMELCISDKKMEEWEGRSPILTILNNSLN